jgi:hypothetical protein
MGWGQLVETMWELLFLPAPEKKRDSKNQRRKEEGKPPEKSRKRKLWKNANHG